jgi:hypothetical protein
MLPLGVGFCYFVIGVGTRAKHRGCGRDDRGDISDDHWCLGKLRAITVVVLAPKLRFVEGDKVQTFQK